MKRINIKQNQTLLANGWMCGALAGLALLLAAGSPPPAQGSNVRNPRILPPDSSPYGASYEEWAARFWQWSLAFPATADPANGTAPASAGQSGKVWYLASVRGSATVTREITVPDGTALFFPVLSVFFNNADCPEPTDFSVDELLEQANGAWDFAASVTTCTIDGVSVAGLEDPQTTPYRLQTGGFPATFADHDNLMAAAYGVPCFPDGGTADPTVVVGAFLLVAPLPAGQHTIHMVGAAGPVEDPFFVKDITYVITVTQRP
ncbi:MAG TPA: hypothetical protein VNU68_18925 [Verrucomicrobiae bacterium]|nr:hypothetical protein [Verrucomicrobiae bacterium]